MFYVIVGSAAAVAILFMISWGGSIERKLDTMNTNLDRIAKALKKDRK